MTDSEAIKKHIDECNSRIENISFFMNSNFDADKEECCNNIEILQKSINTLEKQEKIKEAFEKWKAETGGYYGADDETTRFIITLSQILRGDEE